MPERRNRQLSTVVCRRHAARPAGRHAARQVVTAVLAILAAGLAGLPGCALPAARTVDAGDSGPRFPLDIFIPPPDAGRPPGDAGPEPLAIGRLVPEHGSFRGGTEVEVRGTGFADDVEVRIAGRLPFLSERRNSHQIVLLTPPGEVGPADVEVRQATGTATLSAGYRYDSFYVDPPEGSVAGGTLIAIIGQGTHFAASDEVRIGDQLLVEPQLVNATRIVGRTPPGPRGAVDVEIRHAGGGSDLVPEAYSYYDTSSPAYGGLGGGRILGSLNVSVFDAYSLKAVAGAYVLVGTDLGGSYHGVTDAAGQVTLSGPELHGEQVVTVTKYQYETQSIVRFDARDATVFLVPLIPPEPQPGPFPPGPDPATIRGHILFGAPTGAGVPTWSLVPDPSTPSEYKTAFIWRSERGLWRSFEPVEVQGPEVRYVGDGRRAWEYSYQTDASSMAIYALAGLRDEVTRAFVPYAIGVTRNVVVGPGEVKENVDILVDIPLDRTVTAELVDPPPLDPLLGPDTYRLRLYLDLGAEGLICLPGTVVEVPADSLRIAIPRMPSLLRGLGDASYAVLAAADTQWGQSPDSALVETDLRDLERPFQVGGFLGIPQAVDPPADGLGSGTRIAWSAKSPPDPTFYYLAMVKYPEYDPVWRWVVRGEERQAPLLDLSEQGGPSLAAGEYLWDIFAVSIRGVRFDDWNYRHLRRSYWSAYASNGFHGMFP